MPLFLFNNNDQRELWGFRKNHHDKNNQSNGVSENKESKVICIVVSFPLFSYQFKAISLKITIFLWFVDFSIL